jgi:hypothetical protein
MSPDETPPGSKRFGVDAFADEERLYCEWILVLLHSHERYR